MASTMRLSPVDASFLYFERPTQRLYVGCVALLEGPIPFDAFVTTIGERLAAIPRYRQRPVRPAFDLDWPRWQDDPTFDVRHHLRHVAVPAPGGDAELHELVDQLVAMPFDAEHPLWEAYLIDGVAGGRAALLWKVHHAMVDGISGAQVLEAMSDPTPRTLPVPVPRAVGSPSWLDGLRPSALLETARDAAQAIAILGSFMAESVRALPFNGAITDARRIVWTSFPLDDFLTMRGAAGCKVNDVVLTVITGALRRYLAPRVRLDGVRPRALVPVSVRTANDHLALGNLVTSTFPRLPVDVADPVERLTAMADEMRTLKGQGQARAAGLAMRLVGALPAPVIALLGRLFASSVPPINTVCTNVPGPRETCRLLGRRIVEVHPIVPLFQGVGLEFAILSYGGRLSIAAAVDPHLVPDAGEIPAHLEAAAAELLAVLTGASATVPAPHAELRVADLMTSDVVVIAPTDSIARADRLMRLHRIRHLPVITPEAGLVGIVSQRDLLAASSSSLVVPAEDDRVAVLGLVPVAGIMETHVSVAAPDDPAAGAGERMIRHKIGCLPVVARDGHLAGIVTEEDFLRWATARMAPAEALRQSA